MITSITTTEILGAKISRFTLNEKLFLKSATDRDVIGIMVDMIRHDNFSQETILYKHNGYYLKKLKIKDYRNPTKEELEVNL